MSVEGCPLRFSKNVLAEIFHNLRGGLDNTGGHIPVRAMTQR